MTPDYETHDPKGWCGDPTRGAALGRPTVGRVNNDDTRLYLRKVRLDSGGYDPNGTYFGIGAPLYWCADEEGEVDFMLRAYSREQAKSIIRKDRPNARFYR